MCVPLPALFRGDSSSFPPLSGQASAEMFVFQVQVLSNDVTIKLGIMMNLLLGSGHSAPRDYLVVVVVHFCVSRGDFSALVLL